MPDRYTVPQIADKIGVHWSVVGTAARKGILPADFHVSRNECDPENPCHLEPGTYGHHYAITLADATRWDTLRQFPRTARRKVSDYQAGYAAAVAEVQAIIDRTRSLPDQYLDLELDRWLAGVTNVTLTS